MSSPSSPIRSVKHIVIVGDGGVGKTSLLYAITNGYIEESYEPTIYDREETVVIVDDEEHWVKLHDTAGQEEYENASLFAYKIANVIILCYSIPEKVSFENIEMKWIDKIRRVNHKAPIVLVGTKHDIKTPNFISETQGEALRKRIKANKFIQCSAKTSWNVEQVIHDAVRASIDGRIQERKWLCCC